MKTMILLLLPAWIFCQDTAYQARLYVEVKDTSEVAYHQRYTGRWIQEGFNSYMETQKDSVGIDSFQLVRFYWIDPKGTKIYSEMEERRYRGKRKAKTDFFSFN